MYKQNPTHWFTTLNSVKNNLQAATREGVLQASPRRRLSPSRRAILDLLRDQPEAVPQHAIEQHTGLHGNTIREHLVALIKQGFIRRFPAEAAGRGRPQWLYELVVDPSRNEHVRLAIALADTIDGSSADPEGDAIRAGESWGASLIDSVGHCDAPPQERVLELFDELGFGPEPDRQRPEVVKFHHCPLLGAAVRRPEVVCTVHLGIAKGALEELGHDPSGCQLHQFAEPGACWMEFS